MLLAGLLLKLGTAGFVRILGCFSYVGCFFWVFVSFIGMLLGSLLSVFQSDSKSLAAYSSVTHMSFLLFSLLIFSIVGKSSSFILILAHGFTSTLMFFFIGEFYHFKRSRIIYYFRGFFRGFTFFCLVFMFTFMSNIGVPPSLSFVCELITIFRGLSLNLYLYFLFFVYFLVSFYYSLYYISNCISGQDFLFFLSWNSGYSYFLLMMIFNFFILFFFIRKWAFLGFN